MRLHEVSKILIKGLLSKENQLLTKLRTERPTIDSSSESESPELKKLLGWRPTSDMDHLLLKKLLTKEKLLNTEEPGVNRPLNTLLPTEETEVDQQPLETTTGLTKYSSNKIFPI